MSDSLWSIYNRAEEVRIDGLHAFQISALLESFSPDSFSSWLIWQDGWVDWQDLGKVVDSLFPGVRDRNTQVSSVPEMQPNSGVIAEQSPFSYGQSDTRKIETLSAKANPNVPEIPLSLVDSLPQTSAAEIKKEERRSNLRFSVPIKLFLHIDGSVLKNETSDISLSGMRLKNAITKEPKGSFDVTLVHQGTELAARCRLLVSEGEVTRTRLHIEKCNRIEILRTWIVDPVDPLKKESA